MITVLALNPSIDHTITTSGFQYGGLNRATGARFDAGGKGLNVALCLSGLGADTECLGFMHQDSSRIFETKLIKSATAYDFVWLKGRTRTNIKIVDSETGTVTEVNEVGAAVSPEDIARMRELIIARAERSDYLILSGSMPPGCPSDFYGDIINSLSGLECRCVLDASGESLILGATALPFMVKPNKAELETLVGKPIDTIGDAKAAAMELVAGGISVAAVSLGADGALIADKNEVLFAPSVSVNVRSTVGAGDCMLAGLTYGFLGDNSLEDSFTMGVACATAMCTMEGTQAIDKQACKAMLGMVKTQRI